MSVTLLNSEETAAKLGISVQTLLKWVRERRIEFIKPGKRYRFRQQEIERLLSPHEAKQP